MAALGKVFGFGVSIVPPVGSGGEVFSSSAVRAELAQGDVKGAAEMLGHRWKVEGIVQGGARRGTGLGYPTANIDLGKYLRPRYGVYAVRGRLPDGQVLDGAANIGVRPMFEPPKELLEAYFFDWSGDLYGQCVEVELHAYLRPEGKFDRLDAMVAQMDRDCAAARELLAR